MEVYQTSWGINMGICRKCKYLVRRESLVQNNIELDALIKAKIEQDKRKEKEEVSDNNDIPPSTDTNDNESSDDSSANESSNENTTNNDSSDGSNNDNTGTSTFSENEGTGDNNNDSNIPNDNTNNTTDDTTGDTTDGNPDNTTGESGNGESSTEKEDEKEIVIPEDACFKFVDKIPRHFCLPQPFRIIRERFCPPPLLPMDFEWLCGKEEHIRTENVNGNKFYRPCVIFNRFEECLFFEESGEKEEEIEEDSSVDSDIEADLDGNFV